MKDIKHGTKVAPKIHTWNQSTDSLGAKIHQLCISSYQQVLCVRVYGRTAGTAEAALQFPAEEAGWGLCSYPLLCHLPCACCRVELSVFQGGNSSKDGNTLTLPPNRKKAGSWGVSALFHHKPSSSESWCLTWLWLLLGSSLLGVTLLQSEQTLAFACWMFCLSVCVVWHRKALVTIGAQGERCPQLLSLLPYPRYLVLVYHN